MEKKARLAKEEKEAIDARNKERVRKHQIKEADRRLARHNKKRVKRSMHLWRVYVRVRVQKRKVYSRMMKARLARWKGYADLNKRNRIHRFESALRIQNCFRSFLARHILDVARRKRREEEGKVKRALARLRHRHMTAAWLRWETRTKQMKKVRGLVARGFYRAMAWTFGAWKEFLVAARLEKKVAATKMQGIFRGRKGRSYAQQKRKQKKSA